MRKSALFKNLFLFGFMILSLQSFAVHLSFPKTSSWFDLLQTNESFSISLNSQGCFNSYQDVIVIERIQDSYFIIWNENRKELTQKDIDIIKSFELEVNQLKPGSCTTINTYIIAYKNETTKIVDGNCSFFGMELLKKQILNTL